MTSEGAESPFRVTIATPSIGYPKIQYTYSLAHLLLYFSTHRIYEECDEQSVIYRVKEGAGIDSNRESLVRDMLKTDCTHLLFIDEDVCFDPYTLHILASRRTPIVGCNYPMRVKRAGFTAQTANNGPRMVTNAQSTGLEPCTYMGFGFCLFAREVFEAFGDDPMFLHGWMPEVQQYSTEDFLLFQRCREMGFIPYVDHDASKHVGHCGSFVYTWMDEWGEVDKALPTITGQANWTPVAEAGRSV